MQHDGDCKGFDSTIVDEGMWLFMILCIAEKQNVAEKIANVLGANVFKNTYYVGNEYYITWCVGHLIALSYPDSYDEKYKKWSIDTLPFIPTTYKTEVIKSTKEQYDTIHMLIHQDDVDYIIDCGDAAREGCNIQDLVRKQAGCKKKVKRLWISSLTERAIKDGFNNLRDISEFDNMTRAAFARMKKDYIVGINATRAFTSRFGNGTLLNCGMAQTPTLALVVAQYNKVNEYVPKFYHRMSVELENGMKVRFDCGDKEYSFLELKQIQAQLLGKSLEVVKCEEKRKKKNTPQLFNMTALQRAANERYKYSAKTVSQIAQELYEDGFITYPRTSSHCLEEYMRDEFVKRLNDIGSINKYKQISDLITNKKIVLDNHIINDDEVSDHHAIIVSEKIKDVLLEEIEDKKRNVLELIIERMIISSCESYIFEEKKIEFEACGYEFTMSTTSTLRGGWKRIEALLSSKDHKEDEQFSVQSGMVIPIKKIELSEVKNKAPIYHTESTLLFQMENVYRLIPDAALRQKMKGHGIGTDATRAEIIEGLVENGYIKREKKAKSVYLIPTQKGIQLINIMPDELVSYRLSCEWEMYLDEIEKGEMQEEQFMDIVEKYTRALIDKIKASKYNVAFENHEPIGKCPRCGRDVYERISPAVFSCEGYSDKVKPCKFTLYKEDHGYMSRTKVPLKTGQVKLLLEGKSFVADCFSSKTNKKYRGRFGMVDKGNYINVEMIDFVDKRGEKTNG